MATFCLIYPSDRTPISPNIYHEFIATWNPPLTNSVTPIYFVVSSDMSVGIFLLVNEFRRPVELALRWYFKFNYWTAYFNNRITDQIP